MITIKLKVSEDQIVQVGEDIAFAMGQQDKPGSRPGDRDFLQPFTLELLHEILQKSMKKAVRMVKQGTQISDLCEHINGCMAADQGGNNAG
jgi:hypothetical protein